MGAARKPLVLISGFGPFEVFDRNPSGETAQALEANPPRGWRVRSAVLPVSFARAPAAWDRLLSEGEPPDLLLGLGVSREAGFRLERWGRPSLRQVPRPDVDGRSAKEFSSEGPPLETAVDLERLLAHLHGRGVGDAHISEDAGGYVCERIYHHLLVRASALGSSGLFVHVPPVRFSPLEQQIQVLEWVLEGLLPGSRGDSHSERTSTG